MTDFPFRMSIEEFLQLARVPLSCEKHENKLNQMKNGGKSGYLFCCWECDCVVDIKDYQTKIKGDSKKLLIHEMTVKAKQFPILSRVVISANFKKNAEEDHDQDSPEYKECSAMVGERGIIVKIDCAHGCGELWEEGIYDPMFTVKFDNDGPWGEGSWATYEFFAEELELEPPDTSK